MSSELTTNSTLLTQLQAGNEYAFKVIYETHQQKIYHFAHSFLKDKALSDDVLQETFLSLWTNRARLDPLRNIEPILFTICKRLVIDAFRKSTATSRQRQNLLRLIAHEDNGTEEHILYTDLMQFTESTIAGLPQQQQKVFRLSRFEGRTYEEISDLLSISKNTVKNHLAVASKKLKTVLISQGVFSALLALFFS